VLHVKDTKWFSLVATRRVAERPGRAPTTRAALETQKSTRHHCDIHGPPRNLVTDATKRTTKKRSHDNHTLGRLARQQPERQYANEFDNSTNTTLAWIFTKSSKRVLRQPSMPSQPSPSPPSEGEAGHLGTSSSIGTKARPFPLPLELPSPRGATSSGGPGASGSALVVEGCENCTR
jgi:hypothetical protein